MGSAAISLVAGLWGGLFRLGLPLDALRPELPSAHGSLMVCGFLGTLIGLERAVALGRRWAYAGPALTGAGGLLLVLGVGSWHGPLLIAAGSGVLVGAYAAVLRIQPESFVVVMMLGAAAWLAGNALWLSGEPVFRVVGWWTGFLVLTIAGERLELSRTLLHAPRVRRLFEGLAGLLAGALVAGSIAPDAGARLAGAALGGLALWLYRYDVARHTVRQTGLTRFIAVCLLSGYCWLAVGGALLLWNGATAAGPAHDATLHAVFVGFVFSMIFGHAPIIFPSVLGTPIRYRAFFYVHLALLHLSLLLRLAGDLGDAPQLRRCGGLVNAAAVLLFLAATVGAALTTGNRRTDG